MRKYDLSVLIPSRNEMFLSETVANILSNIRGKTEVIVVLDGQFAYPPLKDDPRLTVIYYPESIGQRAATNQACRLSKAKYVMKIDAHCAVDEGFDVKMMAEMHDDWTMIPMLYNLHGFDWVCIGSKRRSGEPYSKDETITKHGCGHKFYQAPTPEKCPKCGGNMERLFIFKPRFNRKSTHYRFDKTLHFKYWGALGERKGYRDDISESMSAQGSCFMLTRKKYWELDICDEKHGSWGQQGTEVACKTWLSGGKLMINKKTWYSHLFRTQGGDFGFPYPVSGSDQERARKYSRWLFQEGNWKPAKYNLDWLLDRFYPIPDWHTGDQKEESRRNNPTRGIVFYTDNRVSLKIAHAVQNNLRMTGLSIVSASLKPMPHFGRNFPFNLERGYLTMFRQQLAALENSDADIIYMCEHDVLYHPSHFEFIPPRKDVFYYNLNLWKVDAQTGFALKVDKCRQVSGIVAYRKLLVEEYRGRVDRIKREGKFERAWGFEPGTRSIARGGFSNSQAIDFSSKYPNIDIRADHNLTANRWKKEQFRNQDHTKGWKESHLFNIEGWKAPSLNFSLVQPLV